MYDVNWVASGQCGSKFKIVISKDMVRIKFMSSSCEIDK